LINGETPVYITTRDGEEYAFFQPIEARFEEDGTLLIRSRYRRLVRIREEEIATIEVEVADE